jgi:hypothetical protein
MSSMVYCDISISADGYVAGPGRTVDKPFGDGPVDRLHAWMGAGGARTRPTTPPCSCSPTTPATR